MNTATPSPARLNDRWTRPQALLVAVLCLAIGTAGGWFIRGWPLAVASQPPQAVAPAPPNPAPSASVPDPARLKAMADADAAPLLAQLRSDPANPGLLTGIGNLYYDAQQYALAADYYARALRSNPSDAAVRTDLGTAWWYLGKPDAALAEFDRALALQPDNPNTLFNRGLVLWQGKNNAAAARADWNRLLAVAPNYEARDKVRQMIAALPKQPPAAVRVK